MKLKLLVNNNRFKENTRSLELPILLALAKQRRERQIEAIFFVDFLEFMDTSKTDIMGTRIKDYTRTFCVSNFKHCEISAAEACNASLSAGEKRRERRRFFIDFLLRFGNAYF